MFNKAKTWDEARAICQEDSGDLVGIRDGFEQSYLTLLSYLSASIESKPWIGLRKGVRNEYKWSDNWPVEYTNWEEGWTKDNASHQLSFESCAYINSINGNWDVSSCDEKRSFICKISSGKAFVTKSLKYPFIILIFY